MAHSLVKLLVGLRALFISDVMRMASHNDSPGRMAVTSDCSTTTKRFTVANIKSQIKRIGTNRKATERNKAVKSEVKTAIRATREAITAGDKKVATASLVVAARKLDKAASKGVLHKNQAANRKSSIAKQVAAL